MSVPCAGALSGMDICARAKLPSKEKNASNIRFSFSSLCPVLQPLGFVVFEPLAGTPFRRRKLDIENFVSLAGVVGRKGWFATSLLPIFCQSRPRQASLGKGGRGRPRRDALLKLRDVSRHGLTEQLDCRGNE